MVIHNVIYINVKGSRVEMVIHSVVYVNVEDSNGQSQCCICKRRGFNGSNGHSLLHM